MAGFGQTAPTALFQEGLRIRLPGLRSGLDLAGHFFFGSAKRAPTEMIVLHRHLWARNAQRNSTRCHASTLCADLSNLSSYGNTFTNAVQSGEFPHVSVPPQIRDPLARTNRQPQRSGADAPARGRALSLIL